MPNANKRLIRHPEEPFRIVLATVMTADPDLAVLCAHGDASRSILGLEARSRPSGFRSGAIINAAPAAPAAMGFQLAFKSATLRRARM